MRRCALTLQPTFGSQHVDFKGRALLQEMSIWIPWISEVLQQHVQIIVETYNNGSPTPEFNNAGQIFNHDFYWESISPEKRKAPHSKAPFSTFD